MLVGSKVSKGGCKVVMADNIHEMMMKLEVLEMGRAVKVEQEIDFHSGDPKRIVAKYEEAEIIIDIMA